ncbi:MAG: aspartate--tRNA ligase [Parcubacteria group bacterium]|nr:aspartate--tRNA ligase [Parcubacteria group bacterium]
MTAAAPKHVGKEIFLAGWVDVRRDHGKLIFFDLRDRSGKVQLVVASDDEALHKKAETLRPEWVVGVLGVVVERPEKMKNTESPTGSIEVQVRDIQVYAESETPPFNLSGDGYDIGEEHRMEFRYLDLRRPRMLRNMELRNRVELMMRTFFADRGFLEIETPVLSKSTPEGARDYLVPSRLYHGKFYALPQSPQQYKQLLMVAGVEKYFQIVRCFRDEDTRGDRQPEFTQLDVEMSFVTQDNILELIEELYVNIVEKLTPEKRISERPFPRMTYKEVMEKYGTDKPDMRKDKNDPNELAFLFVVDFPMFEWKESEKRWDAVHHPFTKISDHDSAAKNDAEFIKEIAQDPSALVAEQYDFVLNGYEIGGGSIREHRPEVLKAVFEIMGNAQEAVEEKFGHLLRAFRYGVPPHGGIAPGVDRFVMLLAGEPNIREVIAFPKTGDGRDLMMNAPSEANETQLAELGLQLRKD